MVFFVLFFPLLRKLLIPGNFELNIVWNVQNFDFLHIYFTKYSFEILILKLIHYHLFGYYKQKICVIE